MDNGCPQHSDQQRRVMPSKRTKAAIAAALATGIATAAATRPASTPRRAADTAVVSSCVIGDGRQPAARAQIQNNGTGPAAYTIAVAYLDTAGEHTYGASAQHVDQLPAGEKAIAIFEPGSRMPAGARPICALTTLQRHPTR